MTLETYDNLKQYVGNNKDNFTDDLLNMGYTKGYKQGRADAIKELPKCKDCPNWKHSKIRPNYCQVFDWVSDAEDYCSFEKD